MSGSVVPRFSRRCLAPKGQLAASKQQLAASNRDIGDVPDVLRVGCKAFQWPMDKSRGLRRERGASGSDRSGAVPIAAQSKRVKN